MFKTDYGVLQSRDFRLLSKHASKPVCLVFYLQQITLLRGYIHPNEQPVVLKKKCFVLSLHIDDFTFIAHALKHQSERL